MKKQLITLMLLTASVAGFAQNNSKTSGPAKAAIDTTAKKAVNYVDAPDKVFEVTLKVKRDSLWLLNFAISNAPLMETDIRAKDVKNLGLTLQKWFLDVNKQIRAQHLTDSTKAAASKPHN